MTESRLTPRSNGTGTTDRALALTTAVGMVVRVHNGTAYCGTDAHVTLASCLTEHYVGEVDVANLTDSGLAAEGNQTNLSAGKTYLSVLAFLSHELSGVARAPDELSALAGKQLDAVDHRTDRDVPEGDGVADLDIGTLA